MIYRLLPGLFLLLSLEAKAQPDFYQIYGPTVVSYCDFSVYEYFIETNGQIEFTEWELHDATGSVHGITGNSYSTTIFFPYPGTFFLIACSHFYGTQDQLCDTLTIEVVDIPVTYSVEGCYELKDPDGCYQVCAFSETSIRLSDSVNFELIGADEYVLNGTILEITWGAGGHGEIYLFQGECQTELCFDILPEPVADFETEPIATNDTLRVCLEQNIQFTNTSINGLAYDWDFGDGQQSDEFEPTHAYSTAGFYTVTLTTETICDCNAEKQMVVEVLPAPSPQLDCVNSVCEGTRQRYTATTDGCTQYNWSISSNGTIVAGGGSADDYIEVIWHEGPDGLITLSVAGCNTGYCVFENVFRIPIITTDGPITGDQSVCATEVVTYTAPYFPGATYQWQVGANGTIVGLTDQHSVRIQWDDVNVITLSNVHVDYTNCFLECGGSADLPVQITPSLRLQGAVQVCQGADATIQAGSGFFFPTPTNVDWHLEDEQGNIIATGPVNEDEWIYTFNVPPGHYIWVATNHHPDVCSENATADIFVTETPLAPLGIIGETEICPGGTYGFTIEPAGTYQTIWTVVDGVSTHTFQGQSIVYTFGSTGPYSITASHADLQFPACVSDPVTRTLSTIDDFSIQGRDTVCYESIESYQIVLIEGASYSWEIIPSHFGEIRKSNLNTVEVFWTESGNATLRLSVCGQTKDFTVHVVSLPVFQPSGPSPLCQNETGQWNTDQPTLSHQWFNAAGGLISTLPATDLYPGYYAVAVTDNFGCVSKMTFDIAPYPFPKVHLSSPYDRWHCNFLPGDLVITANTDGVNYLYEWFKDGGSLGMSGPTLPVSDFGTYYVIVTNQYGCKTTSAPIEYLDCCPPNNCGDLDGSFPGCAFIPGDFLPVKTILDCNTHRIEPTLPGIEPGESRWIVRSVSRGILDVLDQDIYEYTYDLPGYYQIDLVSRITGFPYTTGVCGHHQQIIDTIPAAADFRSEGVCEGEMIVFEDLTTFLPGESIAAWSWDFGDPGSGAANTSSAQHPNHIYLTPGMYTVTLIVTMNSGCVSTKQSTIEILPGPDIITLYDPTYCEKQAQLFAITSTVFDVIWNFGDPSSGSLNDAGGTNVLHTFDTPGQYVVSVSGNNVQGCPGQQVLNVDIVPNTLSGDIALMPGDIVCYGDSVILTSPPGGNEWYWSDSTQLVSTTTHASGEFDVLITDVNGCQYIPPSEFVEVTPRPDAVIQGREIYGIDDYGPWSDTLIVCHGVDFEIEAFSVSNVSYQWSHGPVTKVLSFSNEGGNLPISGVYTYTVVVTNLTSGCASEPITFHLEVVANPNVPNIDLVSGSGCSFNTNVLSVTNVQAGVDYLWSDGQTGSSITVTDAGQYTVQAINSNGCTTESAAELIFSSASVDQIPGGCHLKCDPLNVCLPPLTGVTSYTIYQNGTPVLTGTTWPDDYMITQDGSYVIEVTTANGCVATSDPLDIMLYTGVGSITVETWFDVDGDGMITAADMLLSGIPVNITSGDGQHTGMTETLPPGHFVFEDYPAEDYLAVIDRNLLPSQYTVVIDSQYTVIATCDDSVVVQLLLMENCTVSGLDISYKICQGETIMIGDSSWSEEGVYEMHMLSVGGCDSVFQVTLMANDSIDIAAQVWADVDHNGIVSPADTLVPGVVLEIESQTNGNTQTGTTNAGGQVVWGLDRDEWIVMIDTSLLSALFDPVIASVSLADTSCGNATVNLLITSSCAPHVLAFQIDMCFGDSVWIEDDWVTDPGIYTYTHHNPVTMCDTVFDYHVTVSDPLLLSGETSWSCVDMGTIVIHPSGTGPFSIYWWNGGPQDTIVTGLGEGVFTVQVSDVFGCSIQDTFEVVADDALSFTLSSVHQVPVGDSIWLEVEGDVDEPGLMFQWNGATYFSCDTCSSTWAATTHDTVVTVWITDADGCTYELATELLLTEDSLIIDRLYVPNVFSPNGDGVNDFWRMYSDLDNTYVHELAIFDRWGTQMMGKYDFDLDSFEGWDGTFKGRSVRPAVYAFVSKLTLGDGQEVYVKGNITLIK